MAEHHQHQEDASKVVIDQLQLQLHEAQAEAARCAELEAAVSDLRQEMNGVLEFHQELQTVEDLRQEFQAVRVESAACCEKVLTSSALEKQSRHAMEELHQVVQAVRTDVATLCARTVSSESLEVSCSALKREFVEENAKIRAEVEQKEKQQSATNSWTDPSGKRSFQQELAAVVAPVLSETRSLRQEVEFLAASLEQERTDRRALAMDFDRQVEALKNIVSDRNEKRLTQDFLDSISTATGPSSVGETSKPESSNVNSDSGEGSHHQFSHRPVRGNAGYPSQTHVRVVQHGERAPSARGSFSARMAATPERRRTIPASARTAIFSQETNAMKDGASGLESLLDAAKRKLGQVPAKSEQEILETLISASRSAHDVGLDGGTGRLSCEQSPRSQRRTHTVVPSSPTPSLRSTVGRFPSRHDSPSTSFTSRPALRLSKAPSHVGSGERAGSTSGRTCPLTLLKVAKPQGMPKRASLPQESE